MKVHVIHVIVDGQNQQSVERFQSLVEKFWSSPEGMRASHEFHITPVFGRDAVRMTAIFSYLDREPTGDQ